MTKKITSLILAFVLICTMVTPAFAASNTLKTRGDYVQLLNDDGYPAITTEEFFQKWSAVGDAFNAITGGKFPDGKTLDASFDEYLISLNMYIVENSGLDIIMLANNIPALSLLSELIANTVELDTVAFRNEMYELRDKFDGENNGSMASICHFLGAYMSIIDKCYFYAVPTENSDIYELYIEMTYRDGVKENVASGLLIDSVSGEVYGKNGNGILGIGFNFNIYDMMLYGIVNGWNRNFGFAVVYDIAGNLIQPMWDITTRRFYFDYNGLEWLIQAWKGTYFTVATGAEVGIYNRHPDKAISTYYNAAKDEQLMPITMKLSHKDTVILDLGPMKHWWINGFKLNGRTYDKEKLKLEFTIVMPDMDMVNAFVEAIENESHNDTPYTVKGTTVSVVW